MATSSRAERTEALKIAPAPEPRKRIAIFIVTYNAVATLRKVLDRIPQEIWEKVEEVYVFDDSSPDDTFLVGMGYKALHGRTKLSIFRNEKNLGYGGNQIRGYRYAIDQGYDIVALLHGDGQYAPEALPDLLRPLETGEADAVFGSRMMSQGAALAGGMPLYKFVGNKILTQFENAMLGTSLSEFHSGYRLYSCKALAQIPFEKNTNDFHFDTQIIIQLHAAGMRIVERPIPTFYGDEICHVNGMKYAKDVVKSVLDYQLHEVGVRHRPEYEVTAPYTLKKSPLSSHAQLLSLVGPSAKQVLDVGFGYSDVGEALRQRGHSVTRVDFLPRDAPDETIEADIRRGLPPLPPGRLFDVILLADVLEHVLEPLNVLKEAESRLADGGTMLISLPNAVHWSVRLQFATGRFDYTNKGILDRNHLRFFTKASAERLFAEAGLGVRSHRTTPVPWEHVIPSVFGEFTRAAVEKADYFFARLRPNAFAYQHLFEVERQAKSDTNGTR